MPRRSPRGRKPAPSSLPQPRPIYTAIYHDAIPGAGIIIRHFEPEDVPSCRRCRRCSACVRPDDGRGRYNGIDKTYDPADRRPVAVCVIRVPVEDLVRYAF